MSEQNKSNVQALGAGFLGFAAVMAIGGGALTVHSWMQSRGASKPVAAAAPIDLGSTSNPAMAAAPIQRARPVQSPPPLTGEPEENEGTPAAAPEAAPAPADTSAPHAAPPSDEKQAAPRLEPTQRSDMPGGGSSAPTAVVKKTAPEPRTKAASKKAVPKLAPAGSNAIASIHYGVTDRSELMGRAAGPVYNMKGASKSNSKAASKAASDVNAQMSDLKRKLEDLSLPPEQRAELRKQLDAAAKAAGVAAPQ